ncbi:YfbK domain-containing protein [Sphingobacterium paludis]|uniref:Ca-activated chloride channel family protein n=1 Tax=Sphingobacterium paludis TaxID=1476465 RepID=A0A4R7CUE1_9SPHI|nr:von Willebrand factor type A domain-containing protein [Sphingobacterium paludis]TDS11060.1 Ca-activated chloride channel family protein [Sphingobacterium paludis]
MKKIQLVITLCAILLGVGTSFGRDIQGQIFQSGSKQVIAGASVLNKRTNVTKHTDQNGQFTIQGETGDLLWISMVGYKAKEVKVKKDGRLEISLVLDDLLMDEVIACYSTQPIQLKMSTSNLKIRGMVRSMAPTSQESYAKISENKFQNPLKEPLSTFAADVDAASYSNVRRMLKAGTLPNPDAVRVEEMINYFQYELKSPTNGDPVAIHTEYTQAPWNTEHRLLRIALKAKDIPKDKLPASNFVFLIDVSGSMFEANKLPLVKSSLKMLVDQLRDQDRVAIVTYAGSADVKLQSTAGNEKMKIKDAIDALDAGGSTAGAAGILKAYQIAREHFIKNGNNRIVMATDGDFNVGASSDEDMETLIEKQRESGIHISLLGYGMGNYKDSKMEILADKGHGNYAYIDNISEARKAIINEFGGTLFTVAKDVKIQVEFNPAYVQAYRLVGYENRLLEAEDFNNDTKIGGDMGVGHSVTALYEIVPTGTRSAIIGSVDPLKYQKVPTPEAGRRIGEVATVKFRYKDPNTDTSKLKQALVNDDVQALEKTSTDLRFATAVAEFGMLLRNSEFRQKSSFPALIARARVAKGDDREGYRMEFIRLAEDAEALWKAQRGE